MRIPRDGASEDPFYGAFQIHRVPSRRFLEYAVNFPYRKIAVEKFFARILKIEPHADENLLFIRFQF